MKIVNITGGLGNQMFQYAFAMVLKQTNPEEDVLVDIQHYKTIFFKKFKGINLHNGYEINEIFQNASLPIARWNQLSRVSYYIPNYILSRIARKILPIRKTEYIPPYSKNYTYEETALYNPNDCYYEGFWQAARYYEEYQQLLQEVYAHPCPNEYNKALISEIQGCESVGIHIRRGDYLSEPEFKDICNVEYYKFGISEILKDGKSHTFYIFSNDMGWCKDNIAPLLRGNKVVYVDGNTGKNSCWDMFLMTYCKDLIIANSSFSWWGAFLSKVVNRVYVPDPWLNRDCEIEIYMKNWIRIKQ